MKEKNTERVLVDILKNYTNCGAEAIVRTANLREDLGLTSFDVIALSTEIEDAFSISIENIDVLAKINTFGDLADLLAKINVDAAVPERPRL